MPDHDVAIIGAGPVGLLLACLLAQAGIDVGVYERRRGTDDRSRAIGIHPPGRAVLDSAGLGVQARREALELDGGEVICDGRILASLSFNAQQRVLILPQHRTHALLVERLEQLHSGALHRGHDVVGILDDAGVVRLSMDVDAERREASASFVVAADGARSGIRQQLGIGWRARPGRGSYAMVDIPDTLTGSRVQLYCEPAGLVESFPLPGDRRRWVAADPRRALGDAASFVEAIRERTGILLRFPARLQPTAFQARQHRAERVAAGRVVLVGDAAHETSPIGGQGMSLGWVAAHHLAAAIERSLRTGQPDFREYEHSAQRAAVRAQRRSAFYMVMGRPSPRMGVGIRNTVIRALGTPLLRSRAAGMITMRGL
ncbi:FAD-dependent oxidoreductase [Microbacterium sp. A588]